MACARPVVASNTGGLREIIRHGVTGYLAEPGDHLDLAQWIMRLLDRENLRQELGAGAGRLVHESTTYQWPSIARRYAAFYQNLACKTPTLKVPEQARGYVEQIRSLAYGLDQTSRGMCSDLFNWMQ
jgi:glycogen synthase